MDVDLTDLSERHERESKMQQKHITTMTQIIATKDACLVKERKNPIEQQIWGWLRHLIKHFKVQISHNILGEKYAAT